MRKAFFLTLALVLIGLAGCSDGGSDTGSDSDVGSSSSMTTTGPPPKPVVLADTLHLLAAPAMVLTLPDGTSEASTPVPSNFGGGGGGGQDAPEAEWTYQVTGTGNVSTADVHIWIEITEDLIQSTNPLQQNACTWILLLALGADGEPERGCLVEPAGVISPGTRELVFNLVGVAAEMEVNETITLSFHRNAFSTSNNTPVFVLSGTEAHDSRAVLKGLKEPVPDA